MTTLLLLLGLLQAADAATSCLAFSRGYREVNPLYGGTSCARVVAVKAAVTVPLLVLLPKLHARHPRWALTLAVVPTASAGVAVTLNLRTLARR